MTFKIASASVREVCNFIPRRPCADSLYAHYPFTDPLTGRRFLYMMGGRVDNAPFDNGALGPPRFVDKVLVSELISGRWTSPRYIVGPHSFPWMPVGVRAADFNRVATENPASYVSSCGTPVVSRVGSKLYMHITASVADPELGTGEHSEARWREPWAYFLAYRLVSNDGLSWTLTGPHREHTNPAIAHAVFYREPTAADIAAYSRPEHRKDYRGMDGIAGYTRPIDGYLYLPFKFYAATAGDDQGQKNGLLRVRAEGDELLGVDIWRGGDDDFEPLPDGRIPDWFNASWGAGNPFPILINGVYETTHGEGFRYVVTFEASGSFDEFAATTGGRGRGTSNCLGYVLSDHPVFQGAHRTGMRMVESSHPTIDGTGQDYVVKHPVYFEDADGWHFGWVTNDYNGDGRSDCGGGLGGYPGLAFFQGEENVARRIGRKRAAGTG